MNASGIWLEVGRQGERLEMLESDMRELSRDFTLNAAADRQAISRYAEENRRKMDDVMDKINARFDAQHNWFLGIFIALPLLLLGTLAGWVATLIKK
ncbi:MAG: hypothetical protein ISN29_02765 [Gammaproteobacteria bacterium AqS3]|nr:hypothetical protein [Gammaproteobacteria bacterium AqS3]